MHSFVDSFTDLLNKEVSTWPEDKQKHFKASKALFLASYPTCKDDSCMALEAMFLALQIGIIKEFNDKGINKLEIDNFNKVFDQMLNRLRLVDSYITSNKLDSGDILADSIGATSAFLLNLVMARKANAT